MDISIKFTFISECSWYLHKNIHRSNKWVYGLVVLCVFFSFVKSKFFNIQTKVEWVDQFFNGCTMYIQFSLEIVCYLICTYFDGFVMCWMCTKIKMNLCEICLVLGVCECAAVGNSSSVLHFSCWCNNIIPWLKIEWLCPRQEALRPFSRSLCLFLFLFLYLIRSKNYNMLEYTA